MTAAGNGRLDGRVALVTGASRGIGAAVARRYAAEGAHVVLCARTPGALEEVDDEIRAGGGAATLAPLDLADFDAIDALGATLYERFDRLDILVGNAAVLGGLSPVGHIEPAVWDAGIRLNLSANYRLIRSLDPLLRRAPAGRAIFVSSGAAPGRAFWGLYAAGKAGLEALARSYAEETENTPVRVNIVDPGAVRTRMRAEAFPGEDPQSLQPPDAVTEVFVDLASADCRRTGELVRAG